MTETSLASAFFIACPKGLEPLLGDEVTALGGRPRRQTVAGVEVAGDLGFAYRCCLWSRLANKVLMPLARVAAGSAEALYEGVASVEWSRHLDTEQSLRVDFSGTSQTLRNTQFAARTVKDAIVDQLRRGQRRPRVERQDPDLVVNVRLHKGRAAINLDLSGPSLHRRGYRASQVAAPLKENLAAALLWRADWLAVAAEGGAFIDPMCGGGTLAIEAALMAADIAPGLNRHFGFERWRGHDPELWASLREEAMARRERGLAAPLPEIRGYDADPRAVGAAQQNVDAAGLTGIVRVRTKALAALKRPTHTPLENGLVLCNPPYGERLGEQEELRSLYRQLGDVLKEEFCGWRAAVFTGNSALGKTMGLRSHHKYKLFNGALPSELLLFTVTSDYFVDSQAQRKARVGELSENARMLANRLTKNRRQREKYFRPRHIDCYRLYDADLPEYAAAIDRYGDYLHIQEYAPPANVEENKAARRLLEIQQAAAQSVDVAADHISVKQRRRQRGRDQYQVRDPDAREQLIETREGQARFLVNLWAYLDTGLFPDHRLVRSRVAALSAGKRLLNLFCYTAAATVQAAVAGARESVNVDLSKTYLDWAGKNFQLNHLSDRHRLVQADCLQWLRDCREGFDVILLDPPSFSNSKRMDETLDIQRDHPDLVARCVELLKPGGTLVFSNNRKGFRLDPAVEARYWVEDITRATIDRDFRRRPRIHHCFLIRPR